jgi:hypothetical protein
MDLPRRKTLLIAAHFVRALAIIPDARREIRIVLADDSPKVLELVHLSIRSLLT